MAWKIGAAGRVKGRPDSVQRFVNTGFKTLAFRFGDGTKVLMPAAGKKSRNVKILL